MLRKRVKAAALSAILPGGMITDGTSASAAPVPAPYVFSGSHSGSRNPHRRTCMVKKMALVAACAGLLATGVAVSPAAAAPAAWNDCPPGHFCLFEHGNGGALMYAYDECSPLIKNIGSVGEGDKISSYWNRSRFRGSCTTGREAWALFGTTSLPPTALSTTCPPRTTTSPTVSKSCAETAHGPASALTEKVH